MPIPLNPLPNGKGELNEREGAAPPLLNLFPFSWQEKGIKGMRSVYSISLIGHQL